MRKAIGLTLLLGGGALAAKRLHQRTQFEPVAGKVVAITGGSRGLGFVLASQLLERGCRVAICARHTDALADAERKLRQVSAEILATECDVSDPAQVSRFLAEATERFGPVDVAVNNAGVMTVGPFDAMGRADVEEAMNTMFWGTYNVSTAVLPAMRARQRGQIVNITSVGGKMAVPHLLPYAAAKFATVGYSEGLAAEVASEGVVVTTVVPGLMRTGSYANALFKGQNTHEYTWFATLGNLPFTSSDAERAADRIIRAIERRETEVFITPAAHIAARAHGILPGSVVEILGIVDRVLPRSNGRRAHGARGYESETGVTRSFLTALGRAAIPRFQHMPGPRERDTDNEEQRSGATP